MSGHTPGPWEIDGLDPYNKAFGISARNAEGYKTPVVVWRGMGRPASEEGKANARLIAAAPDLLAALKLVADSGLFSSYDDRAWGTVNGAIDKAEGQS